MKKIIITGVTGQDGSYMADYLLSNTDYEIYGAVRRLSVPNHKNIEHLKNHPNFKTIGLDLTDSTSVALAINKIKPDYFINFAANSFVGNSWSMPINHMETNCMGVLYCLEAIRNHAPHCRFYNAGSSEQFGDVSYSPQDENHPFKPRSPYGASKCSAHHLVKVYRESHNIYAVQGILFNHESERRGEEFVTQKVAKGVAEIYEARKKGEPFEPIELGNLNSKRDWSHAEDFMDGVWKMLNQDNPQDYVLASGETHSIRELVTEAFNTARIFGVWEKSQFESELKEVYKDNDGNVLVKINPEFYRPAEVELLLGDPSKAQKELGWHKNIEFTELVARMVKNQCLSLKKTD